MSQSPEAPAGDLGSSAGRRRQRYGELLGAILLVFAIQGIAEPAWWEEVLVTVLLGVTLLLALWAAEARPGVLRVALGVVVAVVLLSFLEALSGNVDQASTRLANALLVALAPVAVVVGVVRNLRARQTVTLEAVLGVLCIYILLGMFYGFIYGSIARIGGEPFFAGEQPATVAHCLYFSFITLTTVGYGDFTASGNLGHTLSASEALTGQIYLVTIVSLIVANLGQRRPVSRSQ